MPASSFVLSNMSSTAVESLPAASQTSEKSRSGAIYRRFATFQRWYWALIPLLATAAYVTVLRIGFLSDDYVLLYGARHSGIELRTFSPAGWVFYRPVGTILTWQIGWQLWGYNPLPYHLISLILHAATALILGLWLAEVTGKRSLGWLAGAFFAVFPLHLEAVGWLAAQWDLWAAFFVMLSLYCFTRWWRRAEGRRLYAASLLFYALAIFSKESVLLFLPIFPLSVWLAAPLALRKNRRNLAYRLAPFCIVLALNLGIRLLVWGNVGGYVGAAKNVETFFWGRFLVPYSHMLLSPINTAVFNTVAGQIVGAITSLVLLVGLIWFGRRHRRLLLVAVVWIAVVIAPVIPLTLAIADLQNNRFLYMAAAAYSVLVAALLYEAISVARRWRSALIALTALLLLLSISTTWLQLRPWHTATVQRESIDAEISRLIPLPQQPRRGGMIWYVANQPDNYRGAYIERLGLGLARGFTPVEDVPFIEQVQEPTEVNLAEATRDAYALRFYYDEKDTLYHVDYASGITADSLPPSPPEVGDNPIIWDFRPCSQAVLSSWQAVNALSSCLPGKGLSLQPANADPQLLGFDAGSGLNLNIVENKARFVRLRVAVSYPAGIKEPYISEWFWKGAGGSWSGEQSSSMQLKHDDKAAPYIYWTFIPAYQAGQSISSLRFDPANAQLSSTVEWIALDLVR
ncbi:MAG: hypothetical protein IVW55_13135 [Chloroflexi bacterium]|nr:hypothetical protein [Chloroflexota bacterium]